MGPVTAATRPRARADLTIVELDGEAIVYDDETCQLHRLNSTGRIVFSLCDGSATIRELAADIAETFGLPFEDVEPDVATLMADLRTAGLLESTRPGATQSVGRSSGEAVATSSHVELPPRHLHTQRRGNT